MLRQFLLGLSAVVAVQTLLVRPAIAAETGTDPTHESAASRSPAAADTSAYSGDEEEYNFSWLDPDKKVYVLQNRKYRKKGHFALFASGGFNLSNPYRTEYVGVPRAGYWFTEQLGVEFFYSVVTNSANSNFQALQKVSASALPFVREVRSYFGGTVTWTPWYAKLNFFNKILYFDWFLFGGVGQVNTAFDQNNRADQPSNYATENKTALYFGTGQNFFVTRSFLVRLDLLGMAFKATGADRQSEKTFTNFDFAAGIGYVF